MKFISQAVILCGGKGSRIKNITKDKIPKCLIQFQNTPFLEILIKKLHQYGIDNFILCTGHLSDSISEFIDLKIKKDISYKSLNFIISKEDIPLGTAGALKNCSKYLSGDFSIVINGDTFINYDLKKYILWHQFYNFNISVMLSFLLNTYLFGSVNLKKNKIMKFEEKKLNFFKFAYSGTFITKNKIINDLRLEFSNVEDSLFQDNLFQLYGFKTFSKFYDIGTPKGYKKAKNKLVF